MNEPLTSFECLVKTMSPVHIGSGEKYLNHFDYLVNEQNIQIFNKRKLFSFVEKNCNESEILEFTKSITNKNLGRWLKEKQIDSKEIILRSYNLAGGNVPSEIQVYVKDGAGFPIIPGSSLKGALRTAILGDLGQKYGREALQETLNRIENQSRFTDRDLKFMDQAILKELLGDDPNHNLMRLLSLGDFKFDKSSLKLVEVVIKTLSNNKLGEKHFKIYPEALKSGHEGRGFISFDSFLLREDIAHNGDIFHFKVKLELEYLRHVVNQTSLNIIRKEIAFFEKKYPEVAEFYSKLQGSVESLAEDELIARIAWGSGWKSITGELLPAKQLTSSLRGKLKLAPHRLGFEFPKTRKLVRIGSEFLPLGWVKLKFRDMELARKEKAEERRRRIEEEKKLERKRKEEEKKKAYLESLSPEDRDIAKVADPDTTEQEVVEIYKRADQFPEAKRKELARALKDYWKRQGKWKGKLSNKQKIKVRKIKEILGEE